MAITTRQPTIVDYKPITPSSSTSTPNNGRDQANAIDTKQYWQFPENRGPIIIFGNGSYLNIETDAGTVLELGPFPQMTELSGVAKLWQATTGSTHPTLVVQALYKLV